MNGSDITTEYYKENDDQYESLQAEEVNYQHEQLEERYELIGEYGKID